MNTHGKAAQASSAGILERHYMAAKRALQRSTLHDEAAYRATLRALDCAALHVGIDAMSRIQAKRTPQAGCAASYPPIVRRPANELQAERTRILCRLVDGRPGDMREAQPRQATAADTRALLVVFAYAGG